MPDDRSRPRHQLRKITHDEIRSMRRELPGLVVPIDPDDPSETSRATSVNPRERVLEDRRLRRIDSKVSSRGKVRVGLWLALKPPPSCDVPVDDDAEEIRDLGH